MSVAVDLAPSALRVLLPQTIEAQPPAWGEVVHALDGQTMGTSWQVLLVGPSALRLGSLRQAIERVLAELIAQMSSWEPQSELSRFNRLAAGQSLHLAGGFAEVMRAALQVARASGGAFDPAAGAAVNRWGFGPGHDYAQVGFQPPEAAATPSRGWADLSWLGDSNHLLQPGDVVLDLSAIAKGYAVDRISDLLTASGLAHHLVEVGGELRGSGLKPGGQPWWVELEPPAPQARLPLNRIALHGLAVASSGDYRRFFVDAQGQRHSHTLDPRSGAPIRHGLASVSVLHRSAMWADAWSTALMVLGPSQGLHLATEQGLAALLVQRLEDGRYQELASPAFLEMA